MFFNKRKTISVLLALNLALAGLFLIGCDDGNKETLLDGLPVGNWISSFDEEYSISTSTFTSGFGGAATYVGDIKNIRQDGEGAGYITIQYTVKNDWDGNPDDDAVGKYYVIHWRNRKANSVEISGAARTPDYGDGKATQHDAETEYTVGNGYFAIYSACQKQ